MEELQVLIGMLKDLPAMALWIIAGFWAYKVIIIGSIYGVIRYVVLKFVEWRTFVPPAPAPQQFDIQGICISPEVAKELIHQFKRLRTGAYDYIHPSDVDKLRSVIDEFIAKGR